MNEDEYTSAERDAILTLARHALVEAVTSRSLLNAPTIDSDVLNERRGVFVTLRRRSGELRGCIGTFDASTSLRTTIARTTASAARDSRFVDNPLHAEELDDVVISVTLLTPLSPIENPLDLKVGIDGIYILREQDGKKFRGCFLPEVASEQGWTTARLLSECCKQKMGLDPDDWRAPTDLQFFTFRAIKLREEL